MYDVVAIGEPVIDFVPLGGEQGAAGLCYRAYPGGGAVNVLAEVCAMGGSALLLGAVGQDLFGEFLIREIRARGIETGEIHVTRTKNTGIGFVRLAEDGERDFLAYRDYEVPVGLWGPGSKAAVSACRIFHFTSVSLVGREQRRDTLRAAAFAKREGKIVSFDVNYREAMWGDKDEARELFWSCIGTADIVKLSEQERDFLCVGADNRTCAERISGGSGKMVLISLGAEGSYFHCPGGDGMCRAFAVRARDTTGCGDAFVGTVLAMLASELRDGSTGAEGPGPLARLPISRVQEIVERANAAGALCAMRYGSLSAMPDDRETEEFMRQGGRQL